MSYTIGTGHITLFP